jgi:2-dehydropantoate 2-reductase
MKIGVVGCGALGSFYGAKLCQLGLDVHFLSRSDYDVVRQQGVRVQSVHGNFGVRPHCARDATEIGRCDLVLVSLKTTANREFGRLLPPLVGPQTPVLTLQNGLGNEELLAEMFGPEQVLGGLCFVCLNRVAPGVIRHLAHGNVLLGEFGRLPQRRTRQYADWFSQAGLPCHVVDSLERAHWEKLVWNVPFNGLGVAGAAGYEAVLRGHLINGTNLGECLATDRLLGDDKWAHLVRELMQEIIAAGRAFGYDIPDKVIDDRIERTREMGAYKASTLIDFERGQALEWEALFAEPLRRAQKVGVKTPRLKALCSLLQELDPGQR